MTDIVYFQPLGIKPKICEIGIIGISDPSYIWYLDEPCKILLSDVKLINKDNVCYNEKKRVYEIKQQDNEQSII